MPGREGARDPPFWYAQDEAARARVGDLERRVGELEERTDGLGLKIEGLAASEQNRRRRSDDLTGILKVLALLASVGGAVLAYLGYARH